MARPDMSKSKEPKRVMRARHEELLEACRDTTLVIVDAQFGELFEHCDSVLFDFAERAENDTLQGRFLEAINLLKRRRPDIEHTFRLEINRGFEDFARTGRLVDDDHSLSADGVELSLVEPEDMEESVACQNLTLRANASHFPDLYALAQRLTVINGGVKLKDSQIPGGPHHLVRSFRRSLEGLDVETKIKVVLYALFDRFVIRQLAKVYDELNRILKEAGVLPDLKPVTLRTKGGPAKRPREPAVKEEKSKEREPAATTSGKIGNQSTSATVEESGQTSLANELFDSILDLMAKRRPEGGARGSARRDPDTPASPELLSAISRLQSLSHTDLSTADAATSGAFIPNGEVDAAFIDGVKVTLGNERQQLLDEVDENDLSDVDSDLIDLIGMLFEYMLNDLVLPNSAKALLSHLHTPYLKVGLIDRRMLVDNRHPARHLLDQMIEAGSLWVEEGNPNRGIFPAMRKTVDRVLMEFGDDVGLFDELLADFEAAVQEQRRRIETMEQRSQDTARGRERLQLARQQAAHTIKDLSRRHPLPPPVNTFLDKVWTDHLVFTLLRDPQQGEVWQQAIATTKDLVGLFDPERGNVPSDDEIQTIRNTISQQAHTMDEVHRSSIDLLLTMLDRPPTQWPQPATDPGETAAGLRPAEQESANAVDGGLPPSEALATETDEDEGFSDEENALLEELRELRFGTWLELTPKTGGKPRHIKLSWMSPLTSTCMFVDRSGMQAEVKGLRELAQEILAGRARIIPRPKHPFIDRALVSIRKVLGGESEGPDLPQTG